MGYLNIFKPGNIIKGFGTDDYIISNKHDRRAYLVVANELGNMTLLKVFDSTISSEEEFDYELLTVNNDAEFWDFCEPERLKRSFGGFAINSEKANDILEKFNMRITIASSVCSFAIAVYPLNNYSIRLDSIHNGMRDFIRENRYESGIWHDSLMTKGIKYEYTETDSDIIFEQAQKISKYGWTMGSYAHRELMDISCGPEGKGWLWDAFSKHPNYVGCGCIMMPGKMPRKIDKDGINDFSYYIQNINEYLRKKDILAVGNDDYPWTRDECLNIANKYNKVKEAFCDFSESEVPSEYVMSDEEYVHIRNEYKKWAHRAGTFFCESGKWYHNAAISRKYQAIYEFTCIIRAVTEPVLSNEDIETIKAQEVLPEYLKEIHIQPAAGMKMTKFVNSFCKKTGLIDAANELYPSCMIERNGRMVDMQTRRWDKQRVVYGESINPMDKDVVYLFSVNYLAFLLMSHGDGTTSCHTIDKEDKERRDQGYGGMHAGGTLSYALDPSTIIFKVLDKDTPLDPEEALWQPYILRQLIYAGEDKIVHSRMYPQSNDDNSEFIYDYYRQVQQKLFGELFNYDPTNWWFKKGKTECIDNEDSAHYCDFWSFKGHCVTSTVKHGEFKNPLHIKVGHRELVCVCCGCTWDGSQGDYQAQIECPDCYGNAEDNQVQLANGDWADPDSPDVVRCEDGEYRWRDDCTCVGDCWYSDDDDNLYYNNLNGEHFYDDGNSFNHPMEAANSTQTIMAPRWFIENDTDAYVIDGTDDDQFYIVANENFCLVENDDVRLGFTSEAEANEYGYFYIADDNEWVDEDAYIERMNALSNDEAEAV